MRTDNPRDKGGDMRTHNPKRTKPIEKKYPKGTRFGELTLITIDTDRYYIKARCDCGRIGDFYMKHLITGKIVHCDNH